MKMRVKESGMTRDREDREHGDEYTPVRPS